MHGHPWMLLITYLPFYRIHELLLYFLLNLDLLKAERGIAYIDNVFSPAQIDILRRVIEGTPIELRFGNWRDRSLTFMQIIRDAKAEAGIHWWWTAITYWMNQ